MAAIADLDEIKEVNANCILMANLQQSSTSDTQSDKAPIYDLDGSSELSKEKSTVSSLQKEKKRLKSDFKIREDELLDKQIQLEIKIKELDNILVKMGQSIQTMYMLSPKPDSFYHTKQKMPLGYQNPFYLKQAQQKQHSLYNGKVLLEKHDPPAVFDSEETLQLAQEKAAKFVQNFKSLTKEANESIAKQKALELEIERLLRAVKKCKECKYDRILYDKAYNDMQQKIERLQAQLGDQKGKCTDTPCISDTLDPLHKKLENKNVELEFQVSEQKDTTKGTSTNTKFTNQSTERKPFLQSLRNTFVVRQPNAFQSKRPNFSKTRLPQKVDKTNDLSNPVSSNSIPTTKESKVVENDKVIVSEIFRINPFKASRVDNLVPNKHVKASVRTKSITVSQPHVITKNDVNSKTNGFSPKDVKSTTRSRRSQPRNNLKSDKVLFK
nr:hypothetical protein [Tanacetum cinerariifolium]